MIQNLAELKKLFKLCRNIGVTEFKMNGIEIKFGDMPAKTGDQDDDAEEPVTEGLTPEQLMFYSAGTGEQ